MAKDGFSRRLVLKLGIGAIGASPMSVIASSPKSTVAEPPMDKTDLTLWYKRAANEWTEALPVGNGRLGAMHFGDVDHEHLQLNEGTLWAGGPHDYDHPNALQYLPEIRKLIFEGKFGEASQLADKNVMSQPIGQAPYQTFGDLLLDFDHVDVQDYRRELDLDTAVSTVQYTATDGVHYTRELIASYPDHVIALHLTADKPRSISFHAKLTSPQNSQASASGATLTIEGVGPAFSGIPGVIRFAGLALIQAKGGLMTAEPDHIEVGAADSVTILISMATSYKSYQDVSGDALALAKGHLEAAARSSFADLKQRHIRDHQNLFRRVSINLGDPINKTSTDQRIVDFASEADATLPALYYQYGRYLMISCSRAGGQPATLQGLWNNSMDPPWGSKYTININTEMNYWPVETTALAECHEPLFDMISEIAKTGQKTAESQYGAKGWVTHHNTDGWRGTAPIDGASWGLWPMGGAWLSTHLWEHYRFNGDRSKLRHHYEILKGASEFFLSTLVQYPGKDWLVTNPSTSPENNHGHGSGLCAGATMDLEIIRDLFAACISASETLGLDADLREQLRATRAKLAPLQIGHAGQLQEWLDDWDMDAPEIHHRHVSHLYGLFPSSQITPESTPELANAARRSLEIRGDEGTGWSLAWKINLWARLHDGNHAYRLVKDALRLQGHGGGGVFPNLFDAHPPFQIDGNFGFTSGVTEMLLQSHDDTIHLLPALPDVWPSGQVKGLRARGGVAVEIAWSGGALTGATLHADRAIKTKARYRGQSVDIALAAGQRVKLDANLRVT